MKKGTLEFFSMPAYPARFWIYVIIGLGGLVVVYLLYRLYRKDERYPKYLITSICVVSVVYSVVILAIGRVNYDEGNRIIDQAINGKEKITLSRDEYYRMKYINRWGLMRNTWEESLSEHSLDVAVIAHALATLRNKRFGGNVNAEHITLLALFHDVSEIITGDLPTPVKYNNPQIKNAYKSLEEMAKQDLINLLPEDLQPDYQLILKEDPNTTEWKIIKAADKLSALIKCIEEEKAGNSEFAKAKEAQLTALSQINLPEANAFLEEFIPGFELTLDEQ